MSLNPEEFNIHIAAPVIQEVVYRSDEVPVSLRVDEYPVWDWSFCRQYR